VISQHSATQVKIRREAELLAEYPACHVQLVVLQDVEIAEAVQVVVVVLARESPWSRDMTTTEGAPDDIEPGRPEPPKAERDTGCGSCSIAPSPAVANDDACGAVTKEVATRMCSTTPDGPSPSASSSAKAWNAAY